MPEFAQLEPDRRIRKLKHCDARPPDQAKGGQVLAWLPVVRDAVHWYEVSQDPVQPIPPGVNAVRWRAVRKPDAELWSIVRGRRDKLLNASDWTQLPDVAANVDKLAWITYRQTLRDIPQTYADPVEVRWPRQPGVV